MSSRLLKLTCFIRFLKNPSESDSRIDFSSFDHRTGPRYDRLCLVYILINQIMLFSVDQRLLHCNVTLKYTNLQTCPVSACQMYRCKLARQSRLQNFVKVGITTGKI